MAGDGVRADAVLRVFPEERAYMRVVAAQFAHQWRKILVNEARLANGQLQSGLAERALYSARTLPDTHCYGGLAIGFPEREINSLFKKIKKKKKWRHLVKVEQK